jgi:gliding motility-associated-like protein
MKRIFILCTVLLSFITFTSRASHLLGGEIGYEHISTIGNSQTYRVTLSLFSDCGSTSAALPALIGANPLISLYDGATLVQSLNLTYQAAISDIEITPVCPDEANNTKCISITNPIPGIKRYVYKGDFVINNASANWEFQFQGFVTSGSSAGRTPLITNADVLGGSSLMYMKATLNNLNGVNSSCTFTSDPTPFFCINKFQTYNLGAVDPDVDSLYFTMIDAQSSTVPNSPPPTPITYYAPYTAIAPLPTAAGNFTFSNNTGQMNFTPNLVKNCVVVNRVEEYRNGIKVGSSMREMTFIILDNCNNNLPTDTVTNPTNASIIIDNGEAIVQTCEGQSGNIMFDVTTQDPDGDNIEITWTTLPTGATATVTGNNTTNPVFHFNWDISTGVADGDYTFFITFTDDGCPLASTKTVSKTLRILPFEGGLVTGSQAPCKADSNGFAYIVQAATDTTHYNIIWTNTVGDTLQVAYGDQGDTLFNLVPGVYNVVAINAKGCGKFFNIGVLDPYYGASISAPDTMGCVDDDFTFNNSSYGDLGSFIWNFGDGTPNSSQTSPTHSYPNSGVYTVTLSGVTPIGCRDTARVNIYVDTISTPSFTIDKDSICMGDQITFFPEGGDHLTGITWNFGGEILNSPTADPIARSFAEAGTYTVTLNTTYRNCPDGMVTRDVHIYPFPLVNLGPDSVLCLHGPSITLQNLATNIPGTYRYKWNTGETTPTLTVIEEGTYSLTVASQFDCATTESMIVNKDCYIDVPNSFTPNGDGVNDYFFPRQLLGKSLAGFKMQIFNRWGQIVFDTNKTDGRGWDGKFNDKDQPSGVYIYTINVVLENGKQEKYTGNVTMLR